MAFCWVTALFIFLAATSTSASRINYETDARREESGHRLQVHIAPHSHDDSGWLKTVDQYFWGTHQEIQVAGVSYVLDSVIQALLADPARRFNFAEVSFLSRWWAQQDDDMREQVRTLVKEGRLSFINGGYVQHDEAAAHYVAMIDQTTRGHRFLLKEFGVAPRVGWQIDPFGHSGTQAGLMGASLGFDAVFFGRADYQDMEKRQKAKELEMVWRGTGGKPSCLAQDDTSADVFLGNFASGNYGPPAGFWWEWSSSPDSLMADDPDLGEYNVEERVEDFVQRCLELANVTRGRDIMLTMGSDFTYSNAHVWFKNMDKLIHYVNKDSRIHAFYSTPQDYVTAKHSYNATWPLKTDDFFPYADSPHSYWTGYFTSRPTSKGFIRYATSYLQAARQLEAFVGINSNTKGGPTTDSLEEVVSMTQHHDSITGTAKQHVANDYHKRLYIGLVEAQKVVANALSRLIRGEGGVQLEARRRSLLIARQQQPSLSLGTATPITGEALSDNALNLESCMWLNASFCEPTVDFSNKGETYTVVAYNPLAWKRVAPLRIPVSTSATCHWEIIGPDGENIPSDLVPVAPSTAGLQDLLVSVNATESDAAGDAELVFSAELPPLGYSLFEIRPSSSPDYSKNIGSYCKKYKVESAKTTKERASPALHSGEEEAESAASAQHQASRSALPRSSSSGPLSMTNGLITVDFDSSSGLMSGISIDGGPSMKLSTSFLWYNSSDGLDSQEDRGQSSGAYIFRPNGAQPLRLANSEEEISSKPRSWRELFTLGNNKENKENKGNKESAALSKRRRAVQLDIHQGEEVSEARQVFDDWATLITRVYKGQRHVEIEWTVGPIPFKDGLGREVVLRYESDVASGDVFWTDANGRAMVQRKLNHRPTWDLNVTEEVAGNYYPITAAAYIKDDSKQFAVLTDRAQGAASLRSGELEVMVHRRSLVDDRRGVGEAINETTCGCLQCDCPGLVARGVHWLMLSDPETAGGDRRTLQQLLNDPPVLLFGPGPDTLKGISSSLRRSFSLTAGRVMQQGTHLLTLMRTSAEQVLVRLAHLVDDGEDGVLGVPLSEDLGKLLAPFNCQGDMEELSLSSNQLRSDAEERRLVFSPGKGLGGRAAPTCEAGEAVATAAMTGCSGDCNVEDGVVNLLPLEIRTFQMAC